MLNRLFTFLTLLLFTVATHAEKNTPCPIRVVIDSTVSNRKSTPLSDGFALKEISYDPTTISQKEHRSGVIFSSYTPGNIWHGKVPPFISRTAEIRAEDTVPLTDVFESGAFIFAHYGSDHYTTRIVEIVDAKHSVVIELELSGPENISRAHFDPETQVLYYTVVESNIDNDEIARLHAFSLAEKKELWRTGSKVAHGNFAVFEKHIVTHFGFTDKDDFLFVIDKGNGKTLKKELLKTAANAILRDGNNLTVPCYTGVYQFEFNER